jgi:large subunit ribosomal protein L3
MAYWPRKRAKRLVPRVRTVKSEEAEPGLFAGYKAGMTHIMVVDNRKYSRTKGEKISVPVTVLEIPPLKVGGVRYYADTADGRVSIGEKWADNLDKDLGRKVKVKKKEKKGEKKEKKKEEKQMGEYHDIAILCYTQPPFKRKPEVFEVPLGGSLQEKEAFAKEHLGKEIKAESVFKPGEQIDVIAITKGKGFQGVVKRFGVKLLHHKAEKARRKVGSMGPWHPAVTVRQTPNRGQMGFHQRVDYNKWVLAMGEDGEDVTPAGDFPHYGKVKNYIVIKGSVPGPQKRLVLFRKAVRPDRKVPKQPGEITYISRSSKQ